MNIFESLRSLLLENVLLQQLKDKYVGEEKPVSLESFSKIEQVCKNKFYLIQWLTKKVGTFIIKDEDIYKYEEYFEIFEKNKNKFPYTDINQVKTSDDVQEFIRKCIEIREGNIRFEDQELGGNYLSKNEIEKLERGGGSKYLGMFEDYQVFQITSPTEDNWKVYRDLLGRCKGREQGASIEICTIGRYDYFKSYLKDYRRSSYFVLYNLNDPKSPYQLHLESGQFMDKDDDSEIGINKFKFYEWLGEKSENYKKKTIFNKLKKQGEYIPVEGLGYTDENGRQGVWVKLGYSKRKSTFKNDVLDGLQIEYTYNNRIYSKTMYKDGLRNGLYIEYNEKGDVEEKGNYKDDKRVGVWYIAGNGWRYMTNPQPKYRLVDYDTKTTTYYLRDEIPESKFVGDERGKAYVELYYTNGVLKGKGKKIRLGKSGVWEYYTKTGKLFAKGKYVRGKRQEFNFYFTELVKTRQGNRRMNLTYNVNFANRSIKIFNEQGKQIGKPIHFFDDKADKFLDKIGYRGNSPDITSASI